MRRILLALVRLYPEPFRGRFGPELREQLARDQAFAAARGPLATVAFAVPAALDLVRTALLERWSPSWTVPHTPASEEGPMLGSPNDWLRDFRLSARALRRTPGFTALVVGMLALAIGASAGMFGVVNTVLLRPLPFTEPGRLVSIRATAPGSDMPEEFDPSNEFLFQYREQAKQLSGVATWNSFTSTARTADRVERIRMSYPTPNLFQVLGASPILGRLPVPEDQEGVVVLSYAMWSSWFGRDSTVLGKPLWVSGADRTIIGVMGPDFHFPNDGTMLWFPNPIRPEDVQVGNFGEGLVARLAPGATLESVTSELNRVAQRLPERFGGSPAYAALIAKTRAVVRPLSQQMLGDVSRPLWVLLAAVGIVLIIACANVANLFLVRSETRQRDLAVRRALGASRRELVRLQLAEALLVAGLAGVVAVALTALTFPIFLRAAPEGIPRIGQVHLDLATLGAAFVLALVAGVACGLVPALRGAAPDFQRLREGGRGSTRAQHWLRNALVVGQTALALVLLIGSGLLVRSFWGLRQVHPGYDTKNLFTFQIAPSRPTLNSARTYADFDLQFIDRLRALPGVQLVGLIENVPLDEGTSSLRIRAEGVESGATDGTLLNFTYTAGDYFQSMGIRLLAGRLLEPSDQTSSPGNVLLSRSAANQLWPGEDPVGKRIQRQGSTTWETVVGMVDDVMQNRIGETPEAVIYFPLVPPGSNRSVSSPGYVLKTTRAETIAPEVRALVKEIAPEAPMYRVYTMDFLARRSMVQLSFTMLTLGVVSVLALILGAVGLYGVLSYIVAERTREIGVRMALGAQAGQVRSMVVVQGIKVVLAGVGIGLAVALGTTRTLATLLYGVKPLDVLTFAAMSVSMLVVGVVASYLPARRASNVDPIESLRGD